MTIIKSISARCCKGATLLLCIASLAIALGTVDAVAGVEGKRPNIIVFLSDQQRWDTVGCYGQELPLTPHLDRMAAEGVRFACAFSNQPVCGPTRAILQTGKYATQTGCFRNDIPLPANETTIANRFSAAGYEVGYIGKWHLASTGDKPVPMERRGGYKDFWLASDILEFTSHGYDGHMFDAQGGSAIFRRADTVPTRRPTGCWNTCGRAPSKSLSSFSFPTSSRTIRTTTIVLKGPMEAKRISPTTKFPAT